MRVGGRRVEIVSLKPDALADIWEDVAKVARALERERQGEWLVEQLKARMANIAKQSGAARTRPRGAMIEWIDPLMAGGTGCRSRQTAGGEDCLARPATFAMARLGRDRCCHPDVISCTLAASTWARRFRKCRCLSAAPAACAESRAARRIFVAEGNRYCNRPGLVPPKVWKSWPRSFTPSYSCPAMKGRVGGAMQLRPMRLNGHRRSERLFVDVLDHYRVARLIRLGRELR